MNKTIFKLLKYPLIPVDEFLWRVPDIMDPTTFCARVLQVPVQLFAAMQLLWN